MNKEATTNRKSSFQSHACQSLSLHNGWAGLAPKKAGLPMH